MKIKPLDESTALLQASGKEWCLLATSFQSRVLAVQGVYVTRELSLRLKNFE